MAALVALAPAGALGEVAETEWHFHGNLFEVAGPARLRFLDDPALGNPPNGAPTGLTKQLGQFGTTASMGIPPIQGTHVEVFRVPPPRMATTGEPVTSMGLALWPSNGESHPEGLVHRWTIVMDLLIPTSSFGPGIITPLINFDDNNSNDADLFIAGPVPGGPPHGWVGPKGQFMPAPQIQPNTWLRLVLIVDDVPGPATGFTTRIFVNGDFVGQADFSGALYNMVDPDNPTFVDGSAVPSALWARWGEFPSPWAATPGGAGLFSTATLFSDNDGEGRVIYLAKGYLTDINIPDGQAADLGEPGDDRIVLCDADLNADHVVDVFDLLIFLDEWFAQEPYADLNNDNAVDVFDLLLFLDEWFDPCP